MKQILDPRLSWSGRLTTTWLVSATLVAVSALSVSCGPPEERYELEGEVVSVDADGGKITVAHEPIEGFMDAMTMPFRVRDRRLLSVIEPGDTVRATLVVKGQASWLDELVSSRRVSDGSVLDEVTPSGPELGSPVPDVQLTNQDNQPIRLSQFREKALLVTFIYTRCPLVDFCPKMNSEFSQLEALLQARPVLHEKTQLLTISFDPDFDTPELLRTFALQQPGASEDTLEHWTWATGTQENLRTLGFYLGLTYREDGEQIAHNLRTAFIGPDGTLKAAYTGNDWTAEDLLNDVSQFFDSSRSGSD